MAEEMQQDEEYQQFEEQNGNNGEEQQAENTESTEDNQMQNAGGEDGEDDDEEDDRKLFVGGLSWETTTKDLKEYFEKFGEVTNSTLKTDLETRKSRGFGFVVFQSPESVDKVMAEKEHKLHNRVIDPKKANPRPVNKKVFVGRLDPAVSEDDVKQYFEENFGPVEKIELPFDKVKEQRRAFCFVEFKKLASMKKCLDQSNHKIGSQEVEVKKATPPGGGQNMRGGPRGRGFGPGARGGRGGFQGGYGYQQGGYGGYGYGGYDQGYGGYGYGGYGGYGGYDGYGYGYGGNWGNGGSYDQSYGYGGQSNYGKAQKRGAAHGGYHPYNR